MPGVPWCSTGGSSSGPRRVEIIRRREYRLDSGRIVSPWLRQTEGRGKSGHDVMSIIFFSYTFDFGRRTPRVHAPVLSARTSMCALPSLLCEIRTSRFLPRQWLRVNLS